MSTFSLLTAFEHSVESTKSLILTCALFERQVDADKACDLAQLEVRHQVGVIAWEYVVACIQYQTVHKSRVSNVSNPYGSTLWITLWYGVLRVMCLDAGGGLCEELL